MSIFNPNHNTNDHTPRQHKQLEMVVAHYKEDLSWIRNYQSIVKVYHKGGYPDKVREMLARMGSSGSSGNGREGDDQVVALPNVGRESHTYLYHICHNWDNLADWTVFFQGGKPTWGYRMSNGDRFRYLKMGVESGGHLCSGVTIDDYLLNRSPLFYINTAEVYSDLSQQRMRSLYTRYYNGAELARGGLVPLGGGRGYNVARTPLQSPIDHWGKWDNFRDFRKFVEGKRQEVDNQYSFSLSEFWYRYISFRPFPKTITFAQGAQFAVGRDWIRQRPLKYYQDLLELLSHQVDPYLGYYMEWVWGEIWNPSIAV